MKKTPVISRRRMLAGTATAALLAATGARAAAALPKMQVWKDDSCGCCKDWIRILRKDGFSVEAHDSGNAPAMSRLNVPLKYGSCHTATIGSYVVIGHVPPGDIRRLLREKPEAVGISVPGMPVGSPGMDGPEYQGRKDPYDVVLMLKDGSARTWARYR